ncbi:MAG: 2-C-methyl-D-erythritol 2,4-cyclodiphosphate synthase [Clostridia bacterium]|nr:2-C-methyl-D-erythritol 2,4-cyclodiphosphate synthase [Clostridia bacterium]
MRIGHGYDVHRFTEGDHLVIGGVMIPYEKSFLAHSDGDVLIHAICDALLGASSLPDIGNLFPDNSPEFENIDSKILLKRVLDRISDKGLKIEYIDCTVIAQAPKMAPHIQNMRTVLADTLNISVEMINIKATTEEKLGFTGRKEGISAHSVCILKSKE